jgi:hypothetical protein
MDIIIHEPLNGFANKIYQGDRWRHPTMTDVKFINSEYIVAAHRYSGKIYVIHLHNRTFTIIETLTLTYNGLQYQTESFIIHNNVIYMISFTNILTIIDILHNYRLRQRQSITLNERKVPYHGIVFKNDIVYVTPSNRHFGTEYITTYRIDNGTISNLVTLGDNVRVKAIGFLLNDLIVIAINYKVVTPMTKEGHMFDGAIRLYNSNFDLLDAIELKSTHFDCIAKKGNVFYVTGADVFHGYIYKGFVQQTSIMSLQAYRVHDFPHGIDIINERIGYTSYATSGIHIIEESTLENPLKIR